MARRGRHCGGAIPDGDLGSGGMTGLRERISHGGGGSRRHARDLALAAVCMHLDGGINGGRSSCAIFGRVNCVRARGGEAVEFERQSSFRRRQCFFGASSGILRELRERECR